MLDTARRRRQLTSKHQLIKPPRPNLNLAPSCGIPPPPRELPQPSRTRRRVTHRARPSIQMAHCTAAIGDQLKVRPAGRSDAPSQANRTGFGGGMQGEPTPEPMLGRRRGLCKTRRGGGERRTLVLN